MANNQNADQGPKVSKLPLPVSDSPLVIDLPDGQKIVIGKMTQGSVIEVATWRGVGRPDSRTSRLMLGVGSGNVNEDKEEQGSAAQVPVKPKKPQDWRIVLYYLAVAIEFVKGLPWKKIASKVKSKIKFKLPAKKAKAISPESPAAPSSAAGASNPVQSVKISESKTSVTVDEDIEAWLNKISEKASQKSASTKSVAQSAPKKAPATKKAVKKTAKPKAKRK